MKRKSFTLIELLVVIVIIGILAGVIIVSTSSSINKASIARAQVFSESVKNELMLNLISEYGFNEGTGLVTKDSWGSSADATLDCYGTGCQNPTWSFNCVSENCLEFYRSSSSVGSRVTIPQNTSINLKENQPFTIEYWVNLKSFPYSNYSATIMKGHFGTSYGHLIASENLLIYTDTDDSTELTIVNFFTGNLNKWVHVVQTFDGNQIVVYKNSETNSNYKSVSGISLTINTLPLYVGNNTGANYFFDGLMDGVRIYDSALISFQIKQKYIVGLNSLLANGNISKEEYDQRLNNLAQK